MSDAKTTLTEPIRWKADWTDWEPHFGDPCNIRCEPPDRHCWLAYGPPDATAEDCIYAGTRAGARYGWKATAAEPAREAPSELAQLAQGRHFIADCGVEIVPHDPNDESRWLIYWQKFVPSHPTSHHLLDPGQAWRMKRAEGARERLAE